MTTEQELTDQLTQMRTEIDRLRDELDRLRTVRSAPETPAAPIDEPVRQGEPGDPDAGSSRRQLLRRGGIALGAGIAAATVVGRPAAAASGDPVLQDGTTTGSGTTKIISNGVSDDAFFGESTATSGASWGVRGESNSPAGSGVVGIQDDGTAGSGVIGFAGPGGVVAETTGVLGVDTRPSGTGVWGRATQGIGGRFVGTTAALQLASSGAAPPSKSDPHVAGEIYFDDANDLWVCVSGGSPGIWRQLTAPTAEFGTPFRVYDSRITGGPLVAGSNRVVSVKDAIDVTTGAVVTVDAVPDGATAVFFNLAIAQTVGSGFLAVTPGDAAASSSASINWSASGTVLNNGTTVGVDANRQVKVFAGGTPGASAEFIIDITGFTV